LGCWTLSPYDVIIYLFCTELLLYSTDVTFIYVPLFIICVRLGPSNLVFISRPGFGPLKPGCDTLGTLSQGKPRSATTVLVLVHLQYTLLVSISTPSTQTLPKTIFTHSPPDHYNEYLLIYLLVCMFACSCSKVIGAFVLSRKGRLCKSKPDGGNRSQFYKLSPFRWLKHDKFTGSL
jgi:hypothetical protein